MPITVNTNMAAQGATHQLSRNGRAMGDTLQRVSSGLRVNKAADDAAGLAVAENLDTAGRSARQAIRNVQDGLNIVSVAESATNEVSNLVKRLRELAVQASSETLASTERQYIDSEATAIREEWDRIANGTEFNGITLLEGSTPGGPDPIELEAQVGLNNTSADKITISFGALTSAAVSKKAGATSSPSLATAAAAADSIAIWDGSLDVINGYRTEYGSVTNRFMSALDNLETYDYATSTAESRIRDADYAFEAAELAKHQVMQSAGVSILSQASSLSQAALSLL